MRTRPQQQLEPQQRERQEQHQELQQEQQQEHRELIPWPVALETIP